MQILDDTNPKSSFRYDEAYEDQKPHNTGKDKRILIGSGSTEVAHKNVNQQKAKLSGQKWSIGGPLAIINLRCYNKSGAWNIINNLINLQHSNLAFCHTHHKISLTYTQQIFRPLRNVRIKDIAQVAGVSVGTVDRVIHHRGKVSEENRILVNQTIEQLGYRPNLAARTLANRNSYYIASFTPSSQADHFWQDQKKGLERGALYVKDFGMNIEYFEYDDRKKGALLSLAETKFEKKYDSIIVAPSTVDEGELFLDLCEKNKIPHLLINSSLESTNEFTLGYVGQNSYQSGRLGAKLLDMSCSPELRMVVLHMEKTPQKGSHMIQKEKGFMDFFAKKERPRPDCIVEVLSDYEAVDTLQKKLNKIFEKWDDIGGFFITTSRVHHVVRALSKMDKKDCSLVGFDLIQENIAALYNYPKLFLVNQNPSLQGYYGIMHLFDKFIRQKPFPTTKYLPLDVVTIENISNNVHIEHRDNLSFIDK